MSQRVIRACIRRQSSLCTAVRIPVSTLGQNRFISTTRPLYKEEAQTRAAGTPGQLSLDLVSPNETIVKSAPVYMVTVPAASGVMGILADHAPTIAQLKPGIVTVHTNDLADVTHRFVISGGFAVVKPESTCVTVGEAIKVDDLDIGVTRQLLNDAQSSLAKASGDKEKAEAQIFVDVYEAVIGALESK